jgi:hypothetical protein
MGWSGLLAGYVRLWSHDAGDDDPAEEVPTEEASGGFGEIRGLERPMEMASGVFGGCRALMPRAGTDHLPALAGS